MLEFRLTHIVLARLVKNKSCLEFPAKNKMCYILGKKSHAGLYAKTQIMQNFWHNNKSFASVYTKNNHAELLAKIKGQLIKNTLRCYFYAMCFCDILTTFKSLLHAKAEVFYFFVKCEHIINSLSIIFFNFIAGIVNNINISHRASRIFWIIRFK